MRKLLIVANWKMNKGPRETEDFFDVFISRIEAEKPDCDLVVAPPFVSLQKAAEKTANTSEVSLAAQNVSEHDAGAFTGEISVMMLKEFFPTYVIIGHSERRSLYRETNALLNAKIKKLRAANLKAIFCIGENLAEREDGQLEAVLKKQLTEGMKDLSEKDIADTVIAYEPVWAIGTGVTATSEQAQEAHVFIRSVLEDLASPSVAKKNRILYGGSVTPSNVTELMSQEDIDGALVGGASLDPESFAEIARNACTPISTPPKS